MFLYHHVTFVIFFDKVLKSFSHYHLEEHQLLCVSIENNNWTIKNVLKSNYEDVAERFKYVFYNSVTVDAYVSLCTKKKRISCK